MFEKPFWDVFLFQAKTISVYLGGKLCAPYKYNAEGVVRLTDLANFTAPLSQDAPAP